MGEVFEVDDRRRRAEAPRSTGTRVATIVAAGDLVVLVATGVWLHWSFRPSVAYAWQDLYPGPAVDWSLVARGLHRWSAVVLIGLVIAALVAALLRVLGGRGGALRVGASIASLGLAGGAWWTGNQLPWDQIALWAVTVGSNVGGYRWLWSDDSRFVLARGREVPIEEMQRLFLLHVALGLALVAVAVATWCWQRRRSVARGPDT